MLVLVLVLAVLVVVLLVLVLAMFLGIVCESKLFYTVLFEAVNSNHNKVPTIILPWKCNTGIYVMFAAGSIINVETGAWKGKMSGLGAGLDSFYEYLLKVSSIHFKKIEMIDFCVVLTFTPGSPKLIIFRKLHTG